MDKVLGCSIYFSEINFLVVQFFSALLGSITLFEVNCDTLCSYVSRILNQACQY